ncbi:MAG TPA: beta-ketoacyl synthase N-terminal-like domain-containing protein, partial [Pilimelia sp.]|nr:beta-ketoacyl synthase N-terminal-like domain-containing protein [Pilimelia sp.]
MTRPRRVVVTGIGPVTSIGVGVGDFAAGLRSGRCGVKPVQSFDTGGFDHANACEITDFDPQRWTDRLPSGEYGRVSRLSAAAAQMAVADAGLPVTDLRRLRALVSV